MPNLTPTRFSVLLILSLVISPISSAWSQVSSETEAAHERESLKEPVAIPSNNGIYRGLNELPENIRKSKQFARDMHLLKLRAGQNGEYNYDARVQAHSDARQNH